MPSAGYLLYDTSNMLVYFKYLGDPSAIAHHILFMLAAAYVLDQSIMAFPFIWLALGEISTPSVNLRWGCSVAIPLQPSTALSLHDQPLPVLLTSAYVLEHCAIALLAGISRTMLTSSNCETIYSHSRHDT